MFVLVRKVAKKTQPFVVWLKEETICILFAILKMPITDPLYKNEATQNDPHFNTFFLANVYRFFENCLTDLLKSYQQTC